MTIENTAIKKKVDILEFFRKKLDEFFDENSDLYLYGTIEFKLKVRDGTVVKIDSSITESVIM